MIEIYSSDRKHTLYTTDEDGNKKSLSVFSVKLNIIIWTREYLLTI
jgi:hypothetical protein